MTARLPQAELRAVTLCLSAVVLLVILLCTDIPEILPHGLAATGLVFLRVEVLEIGNNLCEVFAASVESTGYSSEAVASQNLIRC